MGTRACMVAIGAAAVLAGCGSTSVGDLPPPPGPLASPPLSEPPAGASFSGAPGSRGRSASLREGRERLVVDRQARQVVALDASTGREVARANAGVDPTAVVANDRDHAWVTDSRGGSVLVVRRGAGDELAVERRVFLPGGPWTLAKDPDGRVLWVALTGRNELVRLGAHRRPVPRERYATPRDVRRVTILAGGDPVVVTAQGAARRVPAP